MIGFALRRLVSLVGLLLVLSAVVFALQSIAPGDPVKASLGANAAPAAVARERARLGLEDPIIEQYGRFVTGAVRGDLGTSYRTHRSVSTDLGTYLPATAELVLASFTIALLLAGLFAFSSVLKWPGSTLGRGLLLLGATAPPFLLALGGIVLFYSELGWLPAGGRGARGSTPTGFLLIDTLLSGQLSIFVDALRHLALPACVLAVAPAIAIGRILRSSLDQTLDADFVRTARSKGLTHSRVLRRHVIRNSIGPALSMAGLQLGFMFAGVVVVEGIFSWPGIGNYLAASIPVSDFPAIAGVTLVLGSIYVVANAIVDLLQSLADPRLTS